MSDDEQHAQNLGQADSGASFTFPMQWSSLGKNGHVMIKGLTCKIVNMSTFQTGDYAEIRLVAIDESTCPSTQNMDVLNVSCTEYALVNIDDGFLNFMTTEGNAKDDVKVPDSDMGKQIQNQFEEGKNLIVTVAAAMGEVQAVSYKISTSV